MRWRAARASPCAKAPLRIPSPAMNKREFLVGSILTALLPSRSLASPNTVTVMGGGFRNGTGQYSIVTGDEETARNAYLDRSVVNGRGAAIGAHAVASNIIGDGAGVGGTFERAYVDGTFAGHGAKLINVAASGYAVTEYAQIEIGVLNGQYAGHSARGTRLVGTGSHVLFYAIGDRLTAEGAYAGFGCEGENLTMIGDGVSTARQLGPEMPVSEIRINEAQTPWIIKRHGLGKAGARVNLYLGADEAPISLGWKMNDILPFVILGADEVGIVGNKHPVQTPGRAVRLSQNTCRPKQSLAIGWSSVISRDNQVVVNGRDMSGMVDRLEGAEARLEAIEQARQSWNPFD